MEEYLSPHSESYFSNPISREYPDLDFSHLSDDWNSKKGPYASNQTALRERATRIRKWLRDRPEKNILVISHGVSVYVSVGGWKLMNCTELHQGIDLFAL